MNFGFPNSWQSDKKYIPTKPSEGPVFETNQISLAQRIKIFISGLIFFKFTIVIISALCVWVQKNAIGEHSVVQGQISRISSMAITGSNELHAANVSHPIPSLQFRYVLMYYVQVSRRMFMFLFFIGSWSWKILWQTWEIIIVFTFMIEEVGFSTTFVLNLMFMINIYSHHCLR